MIRQLRYVNSRGREISFLADKGPLLLGKTDIFDMERDYSAIGGTIVGFDAGIREASLAVLMREGDAGLHDRFVDVVSYDLAVGEPGEALGRQVLAEVLDQRVRAFRMGLLRLDVHVGLHCAHRQARLGARGDRDAHGQGRPRDRRSGLPHDYPHDYLYSAGASVTLTNPYSLPAKCDIAVAGPCRHPYLIVGSNRYQVLEDVDAGQLLLIRGFGGDGKRDIVVRHRDGTERSVFAKGVARPAQRARTCSPRSRGASQWPRGRARTTSS